MSNLTKRFRASRLHAKLGAAAVFVLVGGVLAGTMASGPATAAVGHQQRARTGATGAAVLTPRHGRFLGILPSTLNRGKISAAANGTPPLTYHGGPVVHSSKVYTIFWAPSGNYIPPAYQNAVNQYFKDVAANSWKTSNVYAAATQYCEGVASGATSCTSASNNFVSYNVTYGGTTVATTAFPTANNCPNYVLGDGGNSKICLTDAQVQTQVNSIIATKHWPTGLGIEYFLFTPAHVGECFDTAGTAGAGCYDSYYSGGFCAYHSSISGTPYAFQPWGDINGCVYSGTPHNYPYPNDDGADPAINVVSHEHNETITDPYGNAWYDSTGYENGDECAWLSLTTSFNGIGDYSQTINNDNYLMQSEWSNRANGCVLKNTYPQPTASFTATAGGTAHSEKFTSTVSDSDDTSFRYSWSFGDGGSATVASPSHTYAAAGTYSVTLTLFDAHGDQAHVVKTVTVS